MSIEDYPRFFRFPKLFCTVILVSPLQVCAAIVILDRPFLISMRRVTIVLACLSLLLLPLLNRAGV